MDNDNLSIKLKVIKSKNEKRLEEKHRKHLLGRCSLALVFLCILLLGVIVLITFKETDLVSNNVGLKDYSIISYSDVNNVINVEFTSTSKQSECAVSEYITDPSKLDFVTMDGDKCVVSVPFKRQFVYFKNLIGVVSKPLEFNNYVVDFKLKDKYYLPISGEIEIPKDMLVVGEPNIEYEIDGDFLSIESEKLVGNANGRSNLVISVNNEVRKEIDVTVTDVIVKLPKEFDANKPFLECGQFTEEQGALLDEILEYRISEAGYGTRAGAVAAARFLTLEFPYRVSYYFENGRLNGTGTHYIDGEGRYYHKGLYLTPSKYDDIVASMRGPKAWGCKMVSYEDDSVNGYYPGGKYPNGLDCSGFVSWTLYNGGFDVGDGGAGETATKGQMTDTGEFKKMTQSMIDNGEVRVGDLLNISGHIAIIAGDDGQNFYVAESLNNYKGLVLKKYAKSKIRNSLPNVVLMDTVYLNDGNLTNMWY